MSRVREMCPAKSAFWIFKQSSNVVLTPYSALFTQKSCSSCHFFCCWCCKVSFPLLPAEGAPDQFKNPDQSRLLFLMIFLYMDIQTLERKIWTPRRPAEHLRLSVAQHLKITLIITFTFKIMRHKSSELWKLVHRPHTPSWPNQNILRAMFGPLTPLWTPLHVCVVFFCMTIV